MHRLMRLALRILGPVYHSFDRAGDWVGEHFLEIMVALYLVLVGLGGPVAVVFYAGRPDYSTGWFLGIVLFVAGAGGIYLLTPSGTARYGHDTVQTWFKGMAGVALAVALAYLNGAASVTDQTKANSDMGMVSAAAVLALLSALVSLRRPGKVEAPTTGPTDASAPCETEGTSAEETG